MKSLLMNSEEKVPQETSLSIKPLKIKPLLNFTTTISYKQKLKQVYKTQSSFLHVKILIERLGSSVSVHDANLSKLSRKFKSVKTIKRLNLDFSYWHPISRKGFGFLSQLVQKTTGLKHLTTWVWQGKSWFAGQDRIGFNKKISRLAKYLTIYETNESIPDKDLKCLKQYETQLKYLSPVSKLSLSLSGYDDKKPQSLIPVLPLFKKLTWLKFEPYSGIKDFSKLPIALKNLTNLRHFNLFVNGEGSEESVQSLLRSIVNLIHLESLFLKIDRKMEKFISFQKLENLAQLKQFKLTIDGQNLKETFLINILTAISGMQSLQYLDLDIKDFKEECQQFFLGLKQSLQVLSQLEKLVLNLKGWSYCTDKTILPLLEGLESMNTLQALDLKLDDTKISDDCLKELSSRIKNRKFLKTLKLNLIFCREATNNGILYLKEGIQTLTQLETLKISLGDQSKWTDDGIKHLRDMLVNLTELKDFYCQISGCDSLTEEAIKDLSFGIGAAKTLRNLKLVLHQSELTDSSLYHIQYMLKQLKNLITLSLELFFDIAKEGIIFLAEGLSSLENLKELSLNIKIQEDYTQNWFDILLLPELVFIRELRKLEITYYSYQKLDENEVKSTAITALRHLEVIFFLHYIP